MKNLKRILLTAACLALTAFAICGTLGNDTQQDQRIAIENVIQQRNADGELIDFVTDRELLIETGELTIESITWENDTTDTLYTNSNAVDKFVSVKNNGNMDANVRTWFAFEMGDLTEEEFKASLVLNINTSAWTWGEFNYGVEIGGQRYAVVWAEYIAVLPAGETTSHPSLLQVVLTEEILTVDGVLDGNHDGKYEIKTYSRAVSDPNAWGSGELTHPWYGK